MPAKSIKFDNEAREAILRGVTQLAKAVRTTLGPSGRVVILEKSFGSPTVTKDGVTVAKEIEVEDPIENIGAQMVKEVSSKASKDAGDGTTTATVYAEAIFKEGLKNITAGANPNLVKRGIDKAIATLVAKLAKASKKVTSSDEIAQVGTCSANQDAEIGAIIAEAMDKVGKDGVITVEEGKALDTNVDLVEGMQFDKGFLSPHFVTDPARGEVVLEDAYVLIHEKKISNRQGPAPVLGKVAEAGKPARHHRRRRRRRSARDPRGQPPARRAAGRGRQGPGLRRPPQGHARRHRHPHRRRSDHGRARHRPREARARPARPGQEDRHR